MKEIEILVPVLDSKEKVLSSLKQFEATGSKHTLDIYFFDPKRPDLAPDAKGRLMQAFRLRKKEEQALLAYKVDHFETDGEWLYSDEYETGVGDFDTVFKIIQLLGFEVLVTVDNTKHTFLTEKYEIVLEEVSDLGLFLEIESMNTPENVDVEKIRKEIRKFIEALGVKIGTESNAGKPELLLKKKNNKQ